MPEQLKMTFDAPAQPARIDAALHEPADYAETAAKWAESAQGAFSSNTVRAWRADMRMFERFCREIGVCAMPAAPETVASFIRWASGEGNYAPASVRRAVASISRAHRAADAPNPCSSEAVGLALRAMHRRLGRTQRQVAPMTHDLLQKILAGFAHETDLRAKRDRALLRLAYECALRRSELVAIEVAHYQPQPEGHAVLQIPRSKCDAEGRGACMFVSSGAAKAVRAYQIAARIESGPLFRRIAKGGRTLMGPLSASAVALITKSRASQAEIPPETVTGLSGHSPRVGLAVDAATQGLTSVEMQLLGRWRSAEMPARYARNHLVATGPGAKLARLQGR